MPCSGGICKLACRFHDKRRVYYMYAVRHLFIYSDLSASCRMRGSRSRCSMSRKPGKEAAPPFTKPSSRCSEAMRLVQSLCASSWPEMASRAVRSSCSDPMLTGRTRGSSPLWLLLTGACQTPCNTLPGLEYVQREYCSKLQASEFL